MQARSLLFTIYGDFIIRYGQEVWIGSLIRALAEFGIAAPAVRVAVSRVTQEGLLQSRKDGNKSYYMLTEKGRRRLEEGVRRVYRQAPEAWDGQWRIVTFTVPDDRREVREQVRAELEWRGFGPLTPNTWISPHRQEEAVRSLAEEYGLQGHLDLFTARYGGPAADRDLVARCWNLPAIAARYAEFVAMAAPRYAATRDLMAAGAEVPDSRCFTERVWLVHEFRKFLHFDPGLPVELLPPDWPGAQALELFWDYYRLLSGGAERFFLGLFYPTPATQAPKARRSRKADSPEDEDPPSRRKRASLLRRGW